MNRKLTTDLRGKITNMFNILVHPKEVKDRIMPIHQEDDLITGKNHKNAFEIILVLTSKTVNLVQVKANGAP